MLKKINFAAIDIGSNAVRLLIKGINEGDNHIDNISKSLMVRIPLRLGEDSFEKGKISEHKERQLIRTIKSFKLLMKVFEVVDYRACATSAMRDAENGQEIAKKIHRETEINLEVIDGEEEARIVYDSHIDHLLQDSQGSYIYVDVGGGSTEVSLIGKGELKSSQSYNIGTVRTLAGKVKPSAWKDLRNDMQKMGKDHPGIKIIGSGGNINKLYRLSESQTPNILYVNRLQEIYEQLKPLSLHERMTRYQLNPDRVDVIIPAAEIFLAIAEQTGSETIFVPTIGIIDGITHTLCAKYLIRQDC